MDNLRTGFDSFITDWPIPRMHSSARTHTHNTHTQHTHTHMHTHVTYKPVNVHTMTQVTGKDESL